MSQSTTTSTTTVMSPAFVEGAVSLRELHEEYRAASAALKAATERKKEIVARAEALLATIDDPIKGISEDGYTIKLSRPYKTADKIDWAGMYASLHPRTKALIENAVKAFTTPGGWAKQHVVW